LHIIQTNYKLKINDMANKLDKLKLVEKYLTRDTLNKFYNLSVGDYAVSIQGRYSTSIIAEVNSAFDLTGDDWKVCANGYVSCRLTDKLSSSEIGDVVMEITLT
jgi:hypothetical protein